MSGIALSPASICVDSPFRALTGKLSDQIKVAGGEMYLSTRNATKLSSASLLLLTIFALALVARSQETSQEKPSSDKTALGNAVQTPTPPQKKLGIELDGPSVITNTDLITLTVTVTDTYGRYVSGLSKTAFSVFDDKQPQEITFFSDDDAPVSVGVIFDVSGSMSGDKVRRARDALSKFIQTSHDNDEYFLIAFNSRAQLLLDKTRDGDSILNKLTFVETKSQTALYDACYLGVEKVQRGSHPKRALLLISDGQDNDSRYTFNEVRKLLKESDVVLYAIGILSGSDAGSSLGMEGQGVLDELSGVSGGKAFFPRSAAEMDDIFEQIALELRHQYSIGYKPDSFANDGKWHRVKVKVQAPRGLPKLFVRSREGYYATAGAK
jgi:Ca-activated chloride channel family protein